MRAVNYFLALRAFCENIVLEVAHVVSRWFLRDTVNKFKSPLSVIDKSKLHDTSRLCEFKGTM